MPNTPSSDKVPSKAVSMDRAETSNAYLRFPNRLQVLKTPKAVQVESNLNQAAALRPPSEKEEYMEEDALMNQYMKQYRLNLVKDGDTFVIDASKPVKLMTEGQVTQKSLEAFRTQLERNGLGDEIDWRGVQEDWIHMDVRFDNADNFERKVDYLASRYAVLKDRIQTQYSGKKLEQEMKTLDTLYTQAKEEMAESYADNIGGFYEGLGQTGAVGDMRESVLSVIDQKADEYTAHLTEHDIYADITDPSKQWLKQDDGYMAFKLRESAFTSPFSVPTTLSAIHQAPYSVDDLAFAATHAKIISEQIKHPEWDTFEIKDSDVNLGVYLAHQYETLANKMEDLGISKGLSCLIKDSFGPFIDKFLDALDEKINRNRQRVADKLWQSGLIRTEYVHREEVYHAFLNFGDNGTTNNRKG